MIQGYQPPELLIRQKLQNVDTSERERLSALIIGPQYTWPDLTVDSVEKVEVDADTIVYNLAFTDADSNEVVANPLEGWRLDEDSVKVFLENAEVPLHTATSVSGTALSSKPNQIRFSQVIAGTGLDATFRGRDIRVGDLVYITESSTSRTAVRKVTGLLGELSTPEYSNATSHPSNPANSSPAVPFIVSAPAKIDTGESIAGTSSTALEDPVFLSEIASRGNKYTDETTGAVHSGAKVAIKILTFTGTTSGTALISFEDGLLPSSVVSFSWNSGTEVLTFAEGSIEMFTEDDALDFQYFTGTLPAVGDLIKVAFKVGYEQEEFVVVDSWGTAPTEDNKFYVKVKSVALTTESAGPSYNYGPAVLTVYDQKGLLPSTDYTYNYDDGAEIIVGDTGLSISIPASFIFRTGDIYVVEYTAAAASSTVFDGVILNGSAAIGNAASQTLAVKFRKSVDGELTSVDFVDDILPVEVDADAGTASLVGSVAWTKYVKEFATNQYPTIVAKVGSSSAPKVYLTWRASKVPADSEGLIQIYAEEDMAQLGKVDPDNDLAFGVYAAIQGASSKAVYALRTDGSSKAAFESALQKVERQDYVYALAPMTNDLEIAKLVAEHCEAMSQDDVKNFRRAYVGVDSPGEYLLIENDSEGNPYTATITSYSGGNKRVSFVQDIDLNAEGVLPGDFIVVDDTRYTIQSVSPSGDELVLKTGPDFPYTSPTALQVWRENSADSQAKYLINFAKSIDSRRCSVVWEEGGMAYDSSGNLFETPVKYVAAFIAGLRSTTIPWLGLSRADVTFLVSAAPMYLKYTRSLLNEVASNGVFVIAQSVEEGPVYVRHQLTTNADGGALAYEDSIGTNLDDLSFQFKDEFEPLIGKTNVTNETLSVAEQRGTTVLVDAKTSQDNPLVGPQIIQFYDENGEPGQVTVKVHPRFKDRFILKAQVEMGLPNNSTIIELTAVSGVSI